MKILLGHNFYQSSSPSGEDQVYVAERAMLERAGHEVIPFERRNDDITHGFGDRLRAAADATWSVSTHREISRLIALHRPDVAHFHNTFPLISPSAYAACQAAGVPVVQTLHNYRLICPGALLMRAGRPCEDCVGTNLLPSVRHGCYRQSRVATVAVASMLGIHRVRGTYRRDVDQYICLTEFARQNMIRGGLPAERITVRPNYLLDPPTAGTGDGNYALYVGRLSTEKGVATLINAWQGIGLPLKVAGDGPLRAELQQLCSAANVRVQFLGLVSRAEVAALMQQATFLVIPSEWYEGFPVTALEAFATATPLIVSNIGALAEIVRIPENGLSFEPGDAGALHDRVQEIMRDPGRLQAMRIANRALFEHSFAPARALPSLEAVYAMAAEPQDSSMIGAPG